MRGRVERMTVTTVLEIAALVLLLTAVCWALVLLGWPWAVPVVLLAAAAGCLLASWLLVSVS